MDAVHNDVNGHGNEISGTIDSPKVEAHTNGDDYSESNTLLPPKRGGIARKSEKPKRKVQWNDRNGNKLAEILVFEPRDVSDSDEESDSDSCICTIM
ncbi:Actin-related protein 2/3 complex subunit 2 [Hibiscus syriacus]|uniref:Actin-related protein 2/3 complex subunit 2 n=1 Tax=Hibiscus syriacus TaxID=106335 RepID=A0A6A2Z8T1_HIBSY|nr:Actin-related protein 2/3 complex subunit 2 [Hibiscus syriacus]